MLSCEDLEFTCETVDLFDGHGVSGDLFKLFAALEQKHTTASCSFSTCW